jgi:hypothetical protein
MGGCCVQKSAPEPDNIVKGKFIVTGIIPDQHFEIKR